MKMKLQQQTKQEQVDPEKQKLHWDIYKNIDNGEIQIS